MIEKWLKWENGKEWGKIKCPMLDDEYVMTYYPEGVPCYYSYTAPFVDDGNVCYYRFDHDEDCWDADTLFCMGEYEEGVIVKFGIEQPPVTVNYSRPVSWLGKCTNTEEEEQ